MGLITLGLGGIAPYNRTDFKAIVRTTKFSKQETISSFNIKTTKIIFKNRRVLP